MTGHDELVTFLQGWIVGHPEIVSQRRAVPWRYPAQPGTMPSHEDLAQELLDTAGFRVLQLGSWLVTTDGQMIEQAVAIVIPPMYRPQYELVVRGLMRAAELQQRGDRRAGGVAVGVLLLGAALVVATKQRAA